MQLLLWHTYCVWHRHTHTPILYISSHVVIITRDNEVIMFSPCVFSCVCVSLCLCLSRCLSGRFKYEGLVPHEYYFAGILLGMPSCASYVSRTHDANDDVTRPQNRSNFEINISPSIFELEHRSKAQNVGNANGHLLVYSTSDITSGQNVCRELAENCGHFEFFEIWHTASIWPQIWKKTSQIMPMFFQWWWHHRWRHRVASKFPSIFMFRRGWFR